MTEWTVASLAVTPLKNIFCHFFSVIYFILVESAWNELISYSKCWWCLACDSSGYTRIVCWGYLTWPVHMPGKQQQKMKCKSHANIMFHALCEGASPLNRMSTSIFHMSRTWWWNQSCTVLCKSVQLFQIYRSWSLESSLGTTNGSYHIGTRYCTAMGWHQIFTKDTS